MRKFNSSFSGYNKNEVNNFINEVTKEYERMLNNLKDKDKKIALLEEKLAYYKNMEGTLNRAIMVAEDASNQIKRVARDESKSIVDDAKKNASRIVNDALIKAEKVENDAAMLKRKVAIFKKRLTDALDEQMDMVSRMDDGDDL